MNKTSLTIEPEETHPENGGGDFAIDNETDNDLEEQNADEPNIIELNQFLMEFGEDLMDAVSKLNPPIYAPVFSFVWLASSADARQSPIRIKAAGLPQGKCSCAPGSFRAPENCRCQTLSNGSDANRISGSPPKRTRPFMVQCLRLYKYWNCTSELNSP